MRCSSCSLLLLLLHMEAAACSFVAPVHSARVSADIVVHARVYSVVIAMDQRLPHLCDNLQDRHYASNSSTDRRPWSWPRQHGVGALRLVFIAFGANSNIAFGCASPQAAVARRFLPSGSSVVEIWHVGGDYFRPLAEILGLHHSKVDRGDPSSWPTPTFRAAVDDALARAC